MLPLPELPALLLLALLLLALLLLALGLPALGLPLAGLLPVLPVALPLLLLPDLRYPPEQALPLRVLRVLRVLVLLALEPGLLEALPGLRAVLSLALPEPVRK